MRLFSVIIPTFNRAALLAEALESVFAQRFRDFDVIVVDDGSTDETAGVLDSYGDRIVVLRQQNRGPGAARNLGAAHAEGKYLAFLDSDDRWFPWTLDVYAGTIIGAAQSPVFVAGTPRIFTTPGTLSTTAETSVSVQAFADYYASSSEWRWYGASSFVIRSDAFHAVDGFADTWINGEDADLAMKLGVAGPFIHVVTPPTFAYRDHASSLVSQSGRTLDGVRHALRMEKSGHYPGGHMRARERRTILTRHFRPVMLTCLRDRQFGAAWQLYFATWSWHFALGRLRFLLGFPIQALAAVLTPARQAA